MSSESERERIAELIHISRFDYDHGKVGGPDSFYNGMRYAERLACQLDHIPHKETAQIEGDDRMSEFDPVPEGTIDDRPPILFRGLSSDPTNLGEVLGQAVGAGSTCWENLSSAGIFQSERASQIVDEAMTWIKANYVERKDEFVMRLLHAVTK
jgi:hypothetical protein